MNSKNFARNELYWGKNFQKILADKHVLVVGIGGVGGYALDALARAGIGSFTIADFDSYDYTNINRQLLALNSTLGLKKTQLFEKRLYDINKDVKVKVIDDFYTHRLNASLFEPYPDFVIDAIDTLRSKIELIEYCFKNSVKIISSLGAGNRIDPEKLYITDISSFKPKDSFSKNVVSKLYKLGIENGLPIVVSSEKSHSLQKVQNREKITLHDGEILEFTKFSPSSTPFVPPVAGYLMASYIVKKWLGEYEKVYSVKTKN